ncbi:heme oxygenase (biliverdin-producing) [Tessaracoccus aquimaris]|uniref:biliverdin-producing heme oxygenase n=1 Tax=Tessaracoccus aquimaris TaxID=1332264 RepID=UPI0013147454|nr:biliverdin-producing heme oxygenase [Tessaracoccus aquimaris]
MERLEALRVDLAALSADGEAEVPLLPAAIAYAERIRDVADQPARLLAHHYTRYLGDLSGGQALGSIFGRALGIESGQPGISFYQFEGIEKVKPCKDRYRELLDGAPLSDEESDAAVEEAVVAFRCNQALFEELESLRD